jgi:hypothetical protein
MGPPLRSFATDVHEASWSRSSGPTEYKVVRLRGLSVISRRTRELRLGTADHPTEPRVNSSTISPVRARAGGQAGPARAILGLESMLFAV